MGHLHRFHCSGKNLGLLGNCIDLVRCILVDAVGEPYPRVSNRSLTIVATRPLGRCPRPLWRASAHIVGVSVMQATAIRKYARKLLAAHGDKAVAEAAQKAKGYEQQHDIEEAKTWRRIEAALREMQGPRAS